MADTHTDHADDRTGAYSAEHALGWIFAIAALALGAIGLLVGFGVVGGTEQGVSVDGAAGPGAEGASDWMQGALWLLPAVSIALLSRALHSADHHARTRESVESHDGMFNAEHAGAYVVAVVTLGAAALAPLVGFDVFDRGNVAQDGIMWGIASIIPAIVTGTLHAVRHHQYSVVTMTVETRPEVRPTGTLERGPR